MKFKKTPDENFESSQDIDFKPNGSLSAVNRYAPTIKKFVKENPGKILRTRDFNEAIGTQTSPIYTRELMKLGILVRHKEIGEIPGHTYSYTWSDEEEYKLNSKSNDEVLHVEWLEREANKWIAKQTGTDETTVALKNLGVTQFVNAIKEEIQHPSSK